MLHTNQPEKKRNEWEKRIISDGCPVFPETSKRSGTNHFYFYPEFPVFLEKIYALGNYNKEKKTGCLLTWAFLRVCR